MKNCINNSFANISHFQYFCQVAVKMVWKDSIWLMAPMGGSRQRGGILSIQQGSTNCALYKMDFLWWLSLNIKKNHDWVLKMTIPNTCLNPVCIKEVELWAPEEYASDRNGNSLTYFLRKKTIKYIFISSLKSKSGRQIFCSCGIIT